MPAAILKTLVYSDIFDYPLTAREVAKYLISDTEVTINTVQKNLKIFADSKLIYTDGGFYFLKGREKIAELRKKRAEWSRKKLEIAKETAEKLKIIPMIKMIGVTGALSMENCQEEDDIDLLIITDVNCLWLTRLLIILLSPLLGIKRRKPADISVRDKICFNLFLEENHLEIKPENLFLAHEVCQVKPIFDRDNIYGKFLNENKWTLKFLPNFVKIPSFKSRVSSSQKGLLSFFNILAFRLQYQYMKPKMTAERVNLHQAFFHPKDLSNKIQKEFESGLLLLYSL